MTSRHRFAVVAALAGAVAVVAVTMAPSDAGHETIRSAGTPASAPPRAPTTVPPTTTTIEALPSLPADGLSRGSQGDAVLALEERLVDRRYDPGQVDGVFDSATEYAVMAFEKSHGMAATGRVDAMVWAALGHADEPEALLPDGGERRVEIDKTRQLLFLYDEGELTLVSHISTGSEIPYCSNGECGSAVTPVGSHRFLWRVDGWRTSRLGRLYNPVYFTWTGIAVHGFGSVPTHPASHGCVRIPMHIADYFPSLVEHGDPVYVFDGAAEVEPLPPFDDAELADAESEEGADGAPAPPVDDGGGPLPPPPEGWLDGAPPPGTRSSTTTTSFATHLG